MKQPMTLCVGASSGGHMVELQALLQHAAQWPVIPTMHVATLGALGHSTSDASRTFTIGECNRSTPIAAARVFSRSVAIVYRERPDVVVSTGSLPLALFCLAARIFGARIIWIDSVSQTDGLSLSGRLVRRFADLFLVQWPEVAAHCPGTVYEGELV